VRITQVTTGAGDGGTTRLAGGQEVSKADPRVEAYGTVDELGAVLGLARAVGQEARRTEPNVAHMVAVLEEVQHALFVVAGELATLPADRREGMRRVEEADVACLEAHIASFNSQLPPLEEFVLAGGGGVAAHLHLARTVCRRAERRVAALAEEPGGAAEPLPLRYLNRLSDLLFVLARWTARTTGQPELTWER
jgi:cob(I)alamin adenosyltransferase